MTQTAKQQRFGKCLLEHVIGSGARSTVYLAWHEGLQIPVAVKVMKRVTGPQEAQSTERFVREARIAAQLSHPNIVRVYDCGEKGDSCYLVLEYIEGENCRDKLDQWGAFDWQRALQIIRQVAEGLAYASRKGIIHRDLKPENIMIDNEGNSRIADLGLAKEIVTHGSSATQDGDVLGTPYYMSPEQIRQPSDVDFRADIYSLGATLHHMVIGEPPFDAATPFEIMAKHLNEPLPNPQAKRPDLPPALCALIMRCMAKDPRERYANYAELIRDLDRVVSGATEPAESPALEQAPVGRVETAALPVPLAPPKKVPARVVRPVELPATRYQVMAKLVGIAALLGYALLIISLHEYVVQNVSVLAASASVVLMLLLPAAFAYAAMRPAVRGPEQPRAADGADGLAGIVADLCERVNMPVPQLHLCRRRDDTGFAYSLFSRGATVHVPGTWLAQAELTPEETEAYMAQCLAGLYTGDSFLRTLLAAPVFVLHLGHNLGGHLIERLATPGEAMHRAAAKGLTLAWLMGACLVVVLLFFHAFWAGVLGLGVLAELLLTAAFERSTRRGADVFAAKVVSLEAVQSLLVVRGLRGPDARQMIEQCMGLEEAQSWSGHPMAPQDRARIIQGAVAHYSEVEYGPDALELGRNVFSVTPSAAERLSRLAGLGNSHSALDDMVSDFTSFYSRLLGLHNGDKLTMQDLAPGRLSTLAGAAAGLLVVAVTGLLYVRERADYASLGGVVALLAFALGVVVAIGTCRGQLSVGRLGWALATSAVALTLVSMVGLCLLGSQAVARFAVQFPVGLVMTFLLSGVSAALFVRLAAGLGAGFTTAPAGPAVEAPPSQGVGAGQQSAPAENMLTPELADAQPQDTAYSRT